MISLPFRQSFINHDVPYASYSQTQLIPRIVKFEKFLGWQPVWHFFWHLYLVLIDIHVRNVIFKLILNINLCIINNLNSLRKNYFS